MKKNTGFRSAHRLGRQLVEEMTPKEGLCAFGVVSGVDDDFDFRKNAPCHAAMGGRMDVHNDMTFMVDAIYPRGGNHGVRQGKITPEMAKMYTNYVLKQSPYAKMFAEKNIHKGFARGYYLYNTAVDSNVLVGGAVLLRMLSEEPSIPEAWYHMVKAGADPDMAVLLAHMSKVSNGVFIISNYSDSGHRALVPTWFNEESIANFITGKHKRYGLYKDNKEYLGFNGMWKEKADNIGDGDEFGNIIYNRWIDALLARNVELDGRKALFDHVGQDKRNAVVAKLPVKEAMPIIAKILNDYRGEINVA